MAEKTERADLNLWRQLATKERKGDSPDTLVWHTPEGIDLKPLWTKADVEDLDFTRLSASHASIAAARRGVGERR